MWPPTPPWRPLVPGMGKGWGEEGGQRGLTDADFYFTSKGRCTLAPGKGGELGGGVGREWYLQAWKVTDEKRKKVADCHASPVLPGPEPKRLQTAFPASSRLEACKVCILAPLSRGRRTYKYQQRSRKPLAKKLEVEVVVKVSRVEEEGEG